MKLVRVLALTLASLLGVAGAVDATETPITRVVKLLQGLAKKTEEEGKKEEDLYETFVCWAKSVIDTKTASNAAASSRIEMLTEYIADIEAGRIEFTSERVDLEKALKTVKGEIEQATNLRDKEQGEFEDAEDEMQMAIAALDKAMIVLKEATAKHKTGVFLAQQARLGLGEGFAARREEAVMLQRAADLGDKALSRGDALFLRRLLTGEVPKPDWKKLNRKATFKMDYKARSTQIQDVLKGMNETFTQSLADAREKEDAAVKTYQELMKTKGEQEDDLEGRLRDMAEENGARDMSKGEAQDEVDALKEQVKNDEKFIKQTQTDLAEKKIEWKDRKSLRQQELAAFSKAIDILYNDDARDLAAKSFKSQAKSFLFLQEGSSVSAGLQRGSAAARLLREAARKSGSVALARLAASASSGSHFDEVVKAINTMIQDLEEEEQTDLENKEQCEKERAEDARSAAKKSRSIDDTTDEITKLGNEIKEIQSEILEKNETIKQAGIALEEARTQRGEENAEWVTSDAEDKEMDATVKRAITVLSDFYKDNNLMLLQKRAARADQAPAGEAPPPPPSTWDAPYGGKTEGATSIITTLELVSEDIQKDIAHAKAAEDEAAAAFIELEKDTKALIIDLNNDIVELDGSKGKKMEAVSQKTQARSEAKGLLDAVLKRMDDAKAGCEFVTINYPVRLKARQVEMDGLEKAKAILLGAAFTPAADEGREMKPGDASFLQRRMH